MTFTLPPARGACPSDKVQYASRKQARAYRRKLGSGPVSIYRCPACGWWHMGHLPTRVRRGEVDKQAWLAATRRGA